MTGSAELLSIGEVATATGLTPDTIRVWERRYGRPQPVRLPSGHRRYTADHVRWLRRVALALAAGHRPSKAVRADEQELAALLDEIARDTPPEEVGALFDAVRGYREGDVNDLLWKVWREQGPEHCLADVLDPLLCAVGRAWAEGTLDVRHEHFLSAVVEHFLRSARLSLPVKRSGPRVLFTTLEGELHTLGLQMAAVTCVQAGGRAAILGASTPVDEIVKAAREAKSGVVGVSVSLSSGGIETDRALAQLRRGLAAGTRLVAGGRGARGVRRGPRGVEYPNGLAGFARWLKKI